MSAPSSKGQLTQSSFSSFSRRSSSSFWFALASSSHLNSRTWYLFSRALCTNSSWNFLNSVTVTSLYSPSSATSL